MHDALMSDYSYCGYNTSSCTCNSFFMSSGGYTGTLPSQMGGCASVFMM